MDRAGEESFFDFSSSFTLYSSDDDEDHHDVDTYIELELRSAASQVASDDDNELRISFSAVVPFPGFSPSSINSAIILSSKPSFSTCEDQNAQLTPAVDSSPQESTPLPSCRLIGNGSTMMRWTPSVDQTNGWGLVRTRKAVMRKLLVKLRSVIISGFGSMRASLTLAQPHPNGRRRLTSFERWLALCKPTEPIRTNSREVESLLKVTEMKFDTMRKLFGSAVSQIKNNKGSCKSNRMNKSCPTSVKSSPVHQLGDASLVHAAIAHCKKSFGQTDDFSF